MKNKSKSALAKRLFYMIANMLTPYNENIKKWERKNFWLRKTGITIGKHVEICEGFYCYPGLEKNVSIGDYCAIGKDFKIWSFNEVSIGKFNMIAADVTLVNGSHDTNTFEPFSGKLKIGNGCWFGNGARLVGSISIGNNVVIGAGTLVLSDIPNNAVVVGIPGKIIKYRELPVKVWHFGSVYFSPQTFDLVK